MHRGLDWPEGAGDRGGLTPGGGGALGDCGAISREAAPSEGPELDSIGYKKPPRISLNQIDKIGERLVEFDLIFSHEKFVDTHEALWAWRVAHRYPLNAVHATFRRLARKVGAGDVSVHGAVRLCNALSEEHMVVSVQYPQQQVERGK